MFSPPVNRLNSALLPTFGWPTNNTGETLLVSDRDLVMVDMLAVFDRDFDLSSVVVAQRSHVLADRDSDRSTEGLFSVDNEVFTGTNTHRDESVTNFVSDYLNPAGFVAVHFSETLLLSVPARRFVSTSASGVVLAHLGSPNLGRPKFSRVGS